MKRKEKEKRIKLQDSYLQENCANKSKVIPSLKFYIYKTFYCNL